MVLLYSKECSQSRASGNRAKLTQEAALEHTHFSRQDERQPLAVLAIQLLHRFY